MIIYKKVKAIFMRIFSTSPKKYLPDNLSKINNSFQDNFLKNRNNKKIMIVNQVSLKRV